MTVPYRGMPLPPIDDELLSAYLDGQVTPAERAAVEAAMAADPAVRARATDLRGTVALLRALPQPAPRRTFILTPEQATAIRPARVPWLTRLFPAVAAVSAVAAVLCLALVAGDLATGGFATKQAQATRARPASEAVNDTTRGTAAIAVAPTSAPAATAPPAAAAARSSTPLSPAAALPGATVAAAGALPAATFAPAPATGGSLASGGSASQVIAPTATLLAPPLAAPTAVANLPPPAPVTGIAPPGGAVASAETHRVPVALVRAGEGVLALLAVAGITLVLLSRRARRG